MFYLVEYLKNVKLIYENQIYVIMKIKDMNLLSAKKLLNS
jgi:hypothetical protein